MVNQGPLLRSDVQPGVMETAKFGNHFLTYVRCNGDGRVISLARYNDEHAARDGHQRWMSKDWRGRSVRELLRDDG